VLCIGLILLAILQVSMWPVSVSLAHVPIQGQIYGGGGGSDRPLAAGEVKTALRSRLHRLLLGLSIISVNWTFFARCFGIWTLKTRVKSTKMHHFE